MARTRLNQEKRHILKVLAEQVVQDTPIDPAIEKRVKDAQDSPVPTQRLP